MEDEGRRLVWLPAGAPSGCGEKLIYFKECRVSRLITIGQLGLIWFLFFLLLFFLIVQTIRVA